MDYPRVGVGVFVRKDGKVLLQQRKGTHGADTWSLPGGHLELYEAPEQCAARESFEETGVRIRNMKVVGFANDMMKDENKHYITIFVESDYESGVPEIKEPHRTSKLGWYSLDKLPQPLFSPLKHFLEKNTYP